MWWLIPAGIGLALIYDSVSSEERKARQRWENKRQEVERSIEEHQKNIELHINAAQESYDFQFLVDLHFSSVKVADSAYQLLQDARTSFAGMGKMLKSAKEEKEKLQAELDNARKEKDRASAQKIIQSLKIADELRKSIFLDRDKMKEQETSILSDVKRLNQQTRRLKECIKDRCGIRGEEWFQRLEARKQSRRLAENG